MANEITVTCNLSASKGGATLQPGSQSKSLTMAGEDMICNPVTIGTSAEALSFGEITGAPAAVLLRNLDSTNYIEFALTSDMHDVFCTLRAGVPNVISPGSATIYARAHTAACRLLVAAVEQ